MGGRRKAPAVRVVAVKAALLAVALLGLVAAAEADPVVRGVLVAAVGRRM